MPGRHLPSGTGCPGVRGSGLALVGACLWGASLPAPSRAQGVSSSSTPHHPTRPARPWTPRALTRAPSPPQTRAGASVESSEAMPGLPAPRASVRVVFPGVMRPTACAAWVGDKSLASRLPTAPLGPAQGCWFGSFRVMV